MRSVARYWLIKRRVIKKNAARDLLLEFLRDILNFNTVKRGVHSFMKKIRLLQKAMRANLTRKHAVLNVWLQQVDAVFKDGDKLLGIEAVGKAKEKIRRLKMAMPKQLRGNMPNVDDTLDVWVSHKAKWQELQKVWATRANQRKKNVESLSQQLVDWERTNTKRKLVVLSLPQDSRGNPNVPNAPASIKALIREMLVPKPQFPRVDSSPLTDEKVRIAQCLL